MLAVTVTPSVVAAIAIAAFALGASKGGFSGLGPLLTLVVALAVPTSVAIGVLLPFLMIGDVFALWVHWGEWDGAILRRLLPGATGGVVVASFFLQALSEDGLRLFLAGATIAFVGFRLVEPALRRRALARDGGEARDRTDRRGRWAGVAGVTAGVTSTVAHVGGPPVAAYLLTARVQPRAFVATTAALFFVVNWLKVPAYIAADLFDVDLLLAVAPTALLIPVGIVFGRWFVGWVRREVFDGLVLVSLLVGAVLLLAI